MCVGPAWTHLPRSSPTAGAKSDPSAFDRVRHPPSLCADNKRLDEWVDKEQMDFTKVKRPEDQKDKKKEPGAKKRKKKKKKNEDGEEEGECEATGATAAAARGRATGAGCRRCWRCRFAPV